MRTHVLLMLAVSTLALVTTACGEDELVLEENPTLSTDNTRALIQVADLDDESKASVVNVQVPSGAQSVALVLDAGSNLVTAGTVINPGGTEVFSFNNDVTTNRTDATDGVYTLLLPNNPSVELTPGDWKVTFITDKSGGFEAPVDALIKTSPASANTLDINLYFVGLEGLDATSAKEDAGFQSILTNVEQVYGNAGISFGATEYTDVTGDDADKFGVLDSTSGPSSELAQLFSLSADREGRSLNFFFVADIPGSGGFSLLGLSGGVPGPPGVHGTTSSGVAVNMADFSEKPETIEIIMAHEAGHYLGLYHTTEANGAALAPEGREAINGFDPIEDTPKCADSADESGNGTLSPSECASADGGNIMFWSPADDSRALSAGQGNIMKRNLLIK